MKRIDLPDGQWAEIREAHELKSGDRRAVNAATEIRVDPDTKELIFAGDSDERMKNALLRRVIENWSLPLGLPRIKPAVLDELTTAQIDALYEGVDEHIKAINASRLNRQADPTPAA